MQTHMAGHGLPGVSSRTAWPSPGPCSLLIRHQPYRSRRLAPALGPPTLASTVKEDRKSTPGVKGDGRTSSGSSDGSGGNGTGMSHHPPSSSPSGSRTASGRKDGSSSSSTSTRPSTPPPQQARPQAPPQQQPQRPLPSASRLDIYMRKHPLWSRFYDTTLLLGDCVMILATEASSERIEWSSFPALVGVLLACWVAAGAVNGDYSPGGTRAHQDVPWQLSMLGPTFGSVLGAALTWSLASTASAAAYAVLVARNALDAAPVVEGLNSDDLSPQLEVVVALLITMTCWRGIASKLRPSSPGSD